MLFPQAQPVKKEKPRKKKSKKGVKRLRKQHPRSKSGKKDKTKAKAK